MILVQPFLIASSVGKTIGDRSLIQLRLVAMRITSCFRSGLKIRASLKTCHYELLAFWRRHDVFLKLLWIYCEILFFVSFGFSFECRMSETDHCTPEDDAANTSVRFAASVMCCAWFSRLRVPQTFRIFRTWVSFQIGVTAKPRTVKIEKITKLILLLQSKQHHRKTKQFIIMSSASKRFVVAGFETCPYFQAAAKAAREAHRRQPQLYQTPVINSLPNRMSYQRWLDEDQHPCSNEAAKSHRTSPFVYLESGKFVGGYSEMSRSIELANV